MEKQGQGIFRAPPYIQNDPKYVKLAEETIIESQLKCKKDVELANSFRLLIKNRRDKENRIEILEHLNSHSPKCMELINILMN